VFGNNLLPPSLGSKLNIKAARSSKTLALIYNKTGHQIPEDHNLGPSPYKLRLDYSQCYIAGEVAEPLLQIGGWNACLDG
jgi:hypothetical protein